MLPGYDLHWSSPPPEFLIQPLNDIAGSQRDPFFLREIKECQTPIQRVFKHFTAKGTSFCQRSLNWMENSRAFSRLEA